MKRKLNANDDGGKPKKIKMCDKIKINNFIVAEPASKIYVLNIELSSQLESDANIVINIRRKNQRM